LGYHAEAAYLSATVAWQGVVPQRFMGTLNGRLVFMITMSSYQGCQGQERDVFANHSDATASFTSAQQKEVRNSHTAGWKSFLPKKCSDSSVGSELQSPTCEELIRFLEQRPFIITQLISQTRRPLRLPTGELHPYLFL